MNPERQGMFIWRRCCLVIKKLLLERLNQDWEKSIFHFVLMRLSLLSLLSLRSMFSPENLITSLFDALNELKVLADTQRMQLQEKDKIIDGLNLEITEYRESERHKDEELKKCRFSNDNLRIRFHELEGLIVDKNNAIIKLTTDLKDCREKCDGLIASKAGKKISKVKTLDQLTTEAEREWNIENLNLGYNLWGNLINADTGLVFKEFEIYGGKYVLTCIGAEKPDSKGSLISLYDKHGKRNLLSSLENLGLDCCVDNITHLEEVYGKMTTKDQKEMKEKGLANF